MSVASRKTQCAAMLTELLRPGCVHDLQHHLSSLVLRELLRAKASKCRTYIDIDRLAIRILDRRVISLYEDSLDELRYNPI